MTKMKKYRCPECKGTFEFLHHPNPEEDPAPRFCPICGFDTQAEYGDVITAPHVQNTAVVKGVDGLYDAMVESSDLNVNAAAELAGCDVSEMSSLKMTDMKDNLRDGDISVAVDTTPVMQSIQQIQATNPHAVGWQGPNANIATFVQGSTQGPGAYAGMKAVSAVRSVHSTMGGVTSDLPPVEISKRQGR